MKAIQLERPFHFRQIHVPEPATAPSPGQALVKVHRVGICGTDYSGYQGKMPFFSYPRIPGHELGVEVAAIGSDVSNVRVGDRCAIEPYMNCQQCYACTRGYTNCCEVLQTLGVHCDGGLRPLFAVPARKLHVATPLTYEQLALVETLAIGCHAINRGKPRPDETVLIIGAGPIGLSVLEFAKLSGARTLIMDMNPQRLDFVRRKMGIAETILARGDQSELAAVTEMTGGKLADIVVDATGNHKSMANALNCTAFAGRLVFVGITTEEVALPDPLLHRREITILASRNAVADDFKRIIRLIEEGRIDTRPWISHQAAFDDMIDAFPQWLKPETGVIKAIVDVGA
jgi:alcohol dehydrogenase